ncbi:MAG: CpXC domain-containing protein [Anaerolineae bacterium]|nr:CpXC domain-containing protein [Anaerolineae bacterium]
MATNRTIQCPSCGHAINATIENLINVSEDPQAKARLLTGRVNTVQCPNCGVVSTIAAPLLYHDGEKELLISYMPMELGLPKPQQEKAIGDLMRELTSKLPKDSIKGYLFQPREALTMQGLIDQILQADGVTPEMMEQQRSRVRLVEDLIQAPPDTLPSLIQQRDAEIDEQFFQALMVMAQRAAQENRPDLAERMMQLQEEVLAHSTMGQQLVQESEAQQVVVREVATDLDNLGEDVTLDDLLDLVISYADQDGKLQALVGLVRPALDYNFFQSLTERIGKAPADEREKLEALREHLTQLTALVDQQQQAAVRNAVSLLQAIINEDDPEPLIRDNVELIDDTFMAVLSANIQEAERRGDISASAMLKAVYQQIVSILQENMQPELRFVNELLSSASDETALQMLAEHAHEYGGGLLEVMDAVGQMLAQHGETEMIEKLSFLRQAAVQELQ